MKVKSDKILHCRNIYNIWKFGIIQQLSYLNYLEGYIIAAMVTYIGRMNNYLTYVKTLLL